MEGEVVYRLNREPEQIEADEHFVREQAVRFIMSAKQTAYRELVEDIEDGLLIDPKNPLVMDQFVRSRAAEYIQEALDILDKEARDARASENLRFREGRRRRHSVSHC